MWSLTRDQRAGLGVEQLVRGGDADEPVAEVAAGAADGRHLEVLGERVVDLPVARDDLGARTRATSSSGSSVSRVHAVDEVAQVALDDEVGAVLLERLDRRRGARGAPGSRARRGRSCPVRSGFCSEPDSANSFSMIFWVRTNQVCSWPVLHDVLERAERVEAGEQRHRQPVARGVEPQRGRAGQDPDAVHRPDRVPVLDALGVVPHPVAVDHAGRRPPR